MRHYDVVIMGGGPGGSTLAALLARRSDLRVGLFEKEVFPREHIGESFAHPLVPVLEESGALPKVLASDCWVKKYGGIYKWDDRPSVAYFDHDNWANDGVFRWSMHVNRAEFDHILLRHARDVGAHVAEGRAVVGFDPDPEGATVTLADGEQVRTRWFVDASGRQNSIAARTKRSWLSSYKNIAIWQHFLGCRSAQTLDGDWNIFHGHLSPIGCFAFRDGWCWYIPVPKLIDGRRCLTHSIGIVTNPEVLREPGCDFTDQETFIHTVRQVPLLRELIADAQPVAPKMLTATNYSRVNDQFANWESHWLLVGDASYFVDPLFSSGIAFATTQAAAAALLLRTTADETIPEQHKQDLWADYDSGWHGMAETFALSIDQWYHSIAKANPDSIYWRSRGTSIDLDIRERTFDALLNTAFTPDLLRIITKGSHRMEDLEASGPFRAAYSMADPEPLDDDDLLSLGPGTTIRQSLALDVPGFKAFIPPPPFDLPAPMKAAIAAYWVNPVENGAALPAPLDAPMPSLRVERTDPDGTTAVESVSGISDRDGLEELWTLLAGAPVRWADLAGQLSYPQHQLVKRLRRAGLLVASRPAADATATGTGVATPVPS